MKQGTLDWKLLVGIIIAYFLIFISFDTKNVFWYLYTATMLFLISIAITNEKVDDSLSTSHFFLWGIISGVSLYILFFIGDQLLNILPFGLSRQVDTLYDRFSLDWIWHYLVLFLIIIPGEELFWRGFVQKRLMRYLTIPSALLVMAALNGGAYIFSGIPLLVIAAFVGGLAWGLLYLWKRSMPLLIVSHLVFDLLLLVVFPLN